MVKKISKTAFVMPVDNSLEARAAREVAKAGNTEVAVAVNVDIIIDALNARKTTTACGAQVSLIETCVFDLNETYKAYGAGTVNNAAVNKKVSQWLYHDLRHGMTFVDNDPDDDSDPDD